METLERALFSKYIFSVVLLKFSSKEESMVGLPEMRHPIPMNLESLDQETTIYSH